ncbi:hypothetical protein ACET6F_20870 [Aeromonas veronii]
MKISYISSLVSVILGTGFAMAATESKPTPEVVGFKPTYVLIGEQLVEGILQVNQTLKIKTEMLKYVDLDKDDEDDKARIYRWVVDGQVIGNEENFTIPPIALKKNLQLEVVPISKTGDPKQGNTIQFLNLHKVGTTGGTGSLYQLVAMAKPHISDLKIVLPDVPAPGKKLSASYSYEGYGVPEGQSEFLWGEKGKTSTMVKADTIDMKGRVPPYLISNDDIGKVLEVSVKPKNIEGLSGEIVTASLESVVMGVPVIKDVNLINHDLPYLFPGTKLSAEYKYDGNGALEDKSLYRWGHVGDNGSMVDASEIIESGKVPLYKVKRDDVGKVIQLSLLPTNETGIQGELVKTSLVKRIADLEPFTMMLTVKSSSEDAVSSDGNIEENSDGTIDELSIKLHPIVNSTINVAFKHEGTPNNVVDPGLNDWYNFQWMVDGQQVDSENGPSYTLRSSDQNKIISVRLSPKER